MTAAKVEAGSIEEMVCKDKGLSALDRRLAEVYAAASKKAVNEQPPVLKAEQRGWIKGRNDCWKSDDRRKCVEDNYRLRIAELQAKYRLVPGTGPVTYGLRRRSEKRGSRHLFQDRSADTDRGARRPGVADVPPAEPPAAPDTRARTNLFGNTRVKPPSRGGTAPRRCAVRKSAESGMDKEEEA